MGEDNWAGRPGSGRAQAHLELPGKLAMDPASWRGDPSQSDPACFRIIKKMCCLAGEGRLTISGSLTESRVLSLMEAIPMHRHTLVVPVGHGEASSLASQSSSRSWRCQGHTPAQLGSL